MAEIPIRSVIAGECMTGRFRFRVQRWTLKPILQIEITATRKRVQYRELDSEPITFWRDATLEQAFQLQVTSGHYIETEVTMSKANDEVNQSKIRDEPTPLEMGQIADAVIKTARCELTKANLEVGPEILKQVLALAASMLNVTCHAYRLKD